MSICAQDIVYATHAAEQTPPHHLELNVWSGTKISHFTSGIQQGQIIIIHMLVAPLCQRTSDQRLTG